MSTSQEEEYWDVVIEDMQSRHKELDKLTTQLEKKREADRSTDFKNELMVSYSGTVPNLFSEGKGVVAEGKLQDKNFFVADRILAKHDENYMPPELKEIMSQNVK